MSEHCIFCGRLPCECKAKAPIQHNDPGDENPPPRPKQKQPPPTIEAPVFCTDDGVFRLACPACKASKLEIRQDGLAWCWLCQFVVQPEAVPL